MGQLLYYYLKFLLSQKEQSLTLCIRYKKIDNTIEALSIITV